MFEEVLRSDAFILSASIFLSKSVMARAGGFDPAMLAEDFDLHLRLSRFVSFRFINQPIYFSRHTTGSLGKKPWLWGEDIIASIEKHTDLLGDSLSPILSDRSRRLALACFEYGAWRDGWRWVHRSMTYLPGTHSKLAAFAGGVLLAGRALARQAAFLILGRSQLVRLKRKLKRA